MAADRLVSIQENENGKNVHSQSQAGWEKHKSGNGISGQIQKLFRDWEIVQTEL